jgi:putative ABC transport system ATP-binding protein
MEVRVEGLSKVYGRDRASVTALHDVTFEVSGPTTLAVTGPSGSGKSTLLHLLGGFDRPSSGSIDVDGREVGSLRGKALVEHRRSVGFVVQRYNLLPGLTAIENVALPLLPLRPDREIWERARDLLDRVGLGDREESLPGELSGGEQQRVAIARALVGKPALVLADEPTGNLDSANASGVVDLLLDVVADGAMLLVATHDPHVAARCAERLTFADGALVSRG